MSLAACHTIQPSPVVGLQDASGAVTCSAFAISETELVTAAHCVNSNHVRYVTREDWLDHARGSSDVAELVAIDREQDRAVLRLHKSDGVTALKSGNPVHGELVTVQAAIADWDTRSGNVSGHYFTGLGANGKEQRRWESTVTVRPGWSGSPVMNTSGEVVGILVSCVGTAIQQGLKVVKACRPGISMFVELP